MKLLALLLVFSAVLYISVAQDYKCEEVTKDFELEFCKKTIKKGEYCGISDDNVEDLCTKESYDASKKDCPKLTEKEYCDQCSSVKSCKEDDECKAEPPSTKKKCYSVCQRCFEDKECDEKAEKGEYAKKGVKPPECSSALSMGISFVLIALAVVLQF